MTCRYRCVICKVSNVIAKSKHAQLMSGSDICVLERLPFLMKDVQHPDHLSLYQVKFNEDLLKTNAVNRSFKNIEDPTMTSTAPDLFHRSGNVTDMFYLLRHSESFTDGKGS